MRPTLIATGRYISFTFFSPHFRAGCNIGGMPEKAISFPSPHTLVRVATAEICLGYHLIKPFSPHSHAGCNYTWPPTQSSFFGLHSVLLCGLQRFL